MNVDKDPLPKEMEPACEGHPQVAGIGLGVRVEIHRPQFQPEPVLEGRDAVDGGGASIYGSVLRDGGGFRMWYQAWPRRKHRAGDSVLVACVESDDGLEWRRPAHGLMEWEGRRDNHLTDLPFHSPSVMIDPTAGAEARFRAFGCTGLHKLADLPEGFPLPIAPRRPGAQPVAYHTAHSADGLHWTIDGPDPVWPWGDVITATWDPWAGHAQAALKHNGPAAGMYRRRFRTASWRGGAPGSPVMALVPDEVDDALARARGFMSADYYGLGLMPGPTVTLGFLWNFRHQAPLVIKKLKHAGSIGCVDISLVYQTERGGRWQHVTGRPDWMTAAEMPDWASGALYTASSPIDVGDETWLYFTGTPDRHGWAGRDVDPATWHETHGFASIGLARWPRGRLMGLASRMRDVLELTPVVAEVPDVHLDLNVVAREGGHARAALLDGGGTPIPGFDFADCAPVHGDQLSARVRWNGSIESGPRPIPSSARIELDNATLYGFRFAVPAPAG